MGFAMLAKHDSRFTREVIESLVKEKPGAYTINLVDVNNAAQGFGIVKR